MTFHYFFCGYLHDLFTIPRKIIVTFFYCKGSGYYISSRTIAMNVTFVKIKLFLLQILFAGILSMVTIELLFLPFFLVLSSAASSPPSLLACDSPNVHGSRTLVFGKRFCF